LKPDLLIKGGTVVDGSGQPAIQADVAISNGKIDDVGSIGSLEGVPTLKAEGAVVSPGFIDIHSHSDFTLAVDPRAVSAIAQGVTLEVVGQCGHGCAPMGDLSNAKSNLYGYVPGYDINWSTVGGYLDHLDSRKPAVNVAALVPNGCLRLCVAGLVNRPSNVGELKEMKKLLGQSLEEGAYGYTTGLEYGIEKDCSEKEIVELCEVTKKAGRFYATHTRNRQGEAKEAIAEAVRAAAGSGVSLQISHISSVARLDPSSRWAIDQALEQVNQARKNGLDVYFDMHTRRFGTTNLSSVLPPWVLEGGTTAIAKRLKDPTVRKDMKAFPSVVSSLANGDWKKVVVYKSKLQPEISGKSIAAISQERGTEAFDTMFDILLAEIDDLHSLMILGFAYNPEDLDFILELPDCMVGSDAIALATDGPLRNETFHGAYSWAPWFFRYFVREKKSIKLEDAVRRITSLPASRIGIKDRGSIRKGAWADIAVFDPATFQERATTFEPNQLATGMKHVVVNGVVTLKDGERTGQQGGHALRAF
jgi:N-acyl-D-aspartate/D-glutamate deacylase